jgi:hypothetical protein
VLSQLKRLAAEQDTPPQLIDKGLNVMFVKQTADCMGTRPKEITGTLRKNDFGKCEIIGDADRACMLSSGSVVEVNC